MTRKIQNKFQQIRRKKKAMLKLHSLTNLHGITLIQRTWRYKRINQGRTVSKKARIFKFPMNIRMLKSRLIAGFFGWRDRAIIRYIENKQDVSEVRELYKLTEGIAEEINQ
jgi:hypothetical protein